MKQSYTKWVVMWWWLINGFRRPVLPANISPDAAWTSSGYRLNEANRATSSAPWGPVSEQDESVNLFRVQHPLRTWLCGKNANSLWSHRDWMTSSLSFQLHYTSFFVFAFLGFRRISTPTQCQCIMTDYFSFLLLHLMHPSPSERSYSTSIEPVVAARSHRV